MDCQSDENKCDEIFGECRCYADVNSEYPKNNQICGIRKRGYVIPCKAGCCDGGCPGQCSKTESREPYSFGYFETPSNFEHFFKQSYIVIILLVIISSFILYRKLT